MCLVTLVFNLSLFFSFSVAFSFSILDIFVSVYCSGGEELSFSYIYDSVVGV